MVDRQVSTERSETDDLPADRSDVLGWLAAAFVVLHVPLAFVLQQSRAVSLVHSAGTLAIGVALAATRPSPAGALWVCAYAGAAGVLWRMVGAPAGWEWSKYAVGAISAAVLLRRPRLGRPAVAWSCCFVAMLLPGIIITLEELGLTEEARQAIAFNVSGPLVLAVGVAAFAGLELHAAARRSILIALLAPAVGCLTLAVGGTLSADDLVFTGESNFATSGGFGPNQVSAVLGLGALLCYLIGSQLKRSWFGRLSVGSLGIAFLSQALLTMSRGGVFTGLLGLVGAAIPTLRVAWSRALGVASGLVLLVLPALLVLHEVDRFSGGAVRERFTDPDTGHRYAIASADFCLFLEHPLCGVGVGLSPAARASTLGFYSAAHTEYSRMVAEHGLFGVACLGLLLSLCWASVGGAKDARQVAWVAALVVWVLAEFLHAAWRLALPSVLLVLTQVEFVEPSSNGQSEGIELAGWECCDEELPAN